MKIKFIGSFTLMLVVAALLTFEACSRPTSKKIVIKGSTTVLPITQKAAEAYKKIKKVSISIEGSGSGNGIKAIIDGTCDIANSSREMKSNEIKVAETKGVKIKEITVAYDMIVPIIHSNNQINNLTLTQLKAIYDGSISNWKEIGGKDEKIVVISRDTSSGTYEVWEDKVMKAAKVRQDALLQASNGAIITAVAKNPKAIGYVGFGYINNSVKALKVNAVEGTIDNGKSGKFPISRKLYIYINEGKISPEAKDFIEFLTGPEGQKLVKQAGFIPL